MQRPTVISDYLYKIRALAREAKKAGRSGGAGSLGYALTTEMLRAALALSREDRSLMMRGLTREESGYLLGIAFSSAVDAVRERKAELLNEGLTAVILEDRKEDWRETLMMLCLLHNSAKKLGTDLRDIYATVKHYATEEMVQLIESYLDDGEKHVESMGYVEEEGLDGFTYRRTV